ncbi:hypothetical protein ACLOJK_015245, partial [Asimina triloba]
APRRAAPRRAMNESAKGGLSLGSQCAVVGLVIAICILPLTEQVGSFQQFLFKSDSERVIHTPRVG